MTTDTSEAGLESLICSALTGHPCDPAAADTLRERSVASLWMQRWMYLELFEKIVGMERKQ